MRKVLILIAFWMGCSTIVFSAPCTESEIPLWEMAVVVPLDDLESSSCPTPPRCFRATISGHDLSVSANTNKTAHLIVENNSKGDIVEDKPFTSSTTVNISKKGDYTLYIISDDTAVIGEFNIE